MEEKTVEPIKLGRIPKNVERSLDTSFPIQPFVYIDESGANELARKKPDTYLKIVENVSILIKDPDFGGYDEKEKSLYLFRDYITKDGFRKAGVKLKIEKEEWKLVELFASSDERVKSIQRKTRLKRIN